MAEHAGPPAAAIHTQQVELTARQSAAANADRILARAVQDAHAASVAGRARLDAVAAEIEGCVRGGAGFAVDTPLGARELQRFLLAKHRELITVVDGAYRDDAAKRALLESLRPRYEASSDRS